MSIFETPLENSPPTGHARMHALMNVPQSKALKSGRKCFVRVKDGVPRKNQHYLLFILLPWDGGYSVQSRINAFKE